MMMMVAGIPQNFKEKNESLPRQKTTFDEVSSLVRVFVYFLSNLVLSSCFVVSGKEYLLVSPFPIARRYATG